jgi:hypothetical protein
MVVALLITIVGSVLVCWLLPKALNSEPPYGTAADIGVGTLVAVIWTVFVYQYLGPWLGLGGWLLLLGSALDGIGFAAIMLWILRKIKG